MYKPVIGLYIVVCGLLFVCCRSNNSQYMRQMELADSLIASRPDSSLNILQNIAVSELKNNSDKARYALLKSMALDKNGIDTTSFELLQPAIDYYTRKGTPDEKLRTCYYRGRIYQNRGELDSAMKYFMDAQQHSPLASDTLTIANNLVAKGTILYTSYKIDDFIKHNLEAALLYEMIGRVDYEVSCLVNALDGCIINRNESVADSLLSVISECVAIRPELNTMVTPYLLSYVTRFGTDSDIQIALQYQNEADTLSDIAKLDMAAAYFKIGETEKARQLLNQANIPSDINTTLKYLALKAEILEKSGDVTGALDAYRKFWQGTDSVHSGIFSHDLLFIQEKHALEMDNMLRIQRKNRLIWFCACLSCILLVIAVIIFYRYRLGRIKYEQQTLAVENMQLKIGRLEAESIRLKELIDQHNALATPIKEAIKVRIEMLNSLLATEITENGLYAKAYDSWRDRLVQDKKEFMNTTRLAFKASHPNFIDYLEQAGLTVDEINYVCLYAIGLRGKEVGEYIQLKRHYHVSSDIRKKLGLDEHQTNIGIYIRKLMKEL